jgi:hydrogenase expression/formation protein HypC
LAGKSKPDDGTGGNDSMCLGIPMQITAIDGYTAHCEAKGVVRDASLLMLQEESLQAGDYIVVHLGYAIQKITAQEARTAWELYDQMLEGGYA